MRRVTSRAKKQTSLCPQTIRIRHRLAEWTKSGRKYWDLYRWLLDPIVLCDATKLVLKNAGAAGIDDVTCESVKGKEWEFSVEISNKLRRGTFRPCAVKRVYIPKKDGKKRPLGIPTLEDRVVQRALVLLLEPIYELVFLPNSYGFRRGRSGVECVAVTAEEVYRHRLVLEADIEGFFDNVSHGKLRGMLKEKIVDPRVLNLIGEFLRAGFLERDKPWQASWQGTPQGGPLSPLLANIYLHYALDIRFQELKLRNTKLLRFCDDFVIVSQRESELLAVRRFLYSWMREAGLKLKDSKTKMIDMRNHKRSRESHFDFLGFRFHLRAYKDNPKRFWIARQPSQRARLALRENVKKKVFPNHSTGQARKLILETWKGWCGYFRYGNSNRIFYREIKSLHGITRWYLRRKYRQQRRPVPWYQLQPLEKKILQNVKPMSVIPDYLRRQQQRLL
jgi:RNA-directed DNA polymerase